MKKRVLGTLLGAAMAATVLVGCGSDNASKDSSSKTATSGSEKKGNSSDGSGKIGISMPTQSLERWNRDGAYLDDQFKKAGYETVLTFSDNDSGKQVNDIQNMLADGVD